MLQIRHFSLIAIHLTAVAMSIAVLFCTLWMTYTTENKTREFVVVSDWCCWVHVLKKLHPSLMHVNCVAHLLHNCAVRVHFKNIDEIIATIKAATIKNKDRKNDFHDTGLLSPPDHVITRWATWLRAVLSLQWEPSSCLCHCQQLDKRRPLSQQSKRRYQCGRFGTELCLNKSISLSNSQRRVPKRKCLLDYKAYGMQKKMQFDDDPCTIKDNIKKRLSKCDLETIINCTNLTIDPTSSTLLQKAQSTSAAVERSFTNQLKLVDISN